jgi:N6-adenosine-specific RNA methylase IME4
MSIARIETITVKKRYREDLGDIKKLAASIESVGLLHPIVVTTDLTLIAGQRRLEACKLLGWSDIPVTTINLDDIIQGEYAENSDRKDFGPTEIVAIKRALEPALKEAAQERMLSGKPGGNLPQGQTGKTRDKVAAFAGVSGRTIEKAEAVVKAAEEDQEKFGHLVEEMQKSGKVNSAYRKLKQEKDQQEVLSIKPVEGKYKTIVIDPPWDYEWLSLAGRAAPGYATMTHDELLALPVESWADDDAHIYIWTTNNFIARACDLMVAWGFQHKTVLTWVKPRIGLGSYFRNSTEHVLFGMRGELKTRSDSIATHFEAPVGEHSVKPDIFYSLVEKASYPTYLEAFCRTPREGWSAWGNIKSE